MDTQRLERRCLSQKLMGWGELLNVNDYDIFDILDGNLIVVLDLQYLCNDRFLNN